MKKLKRQLKQHLKPEQNREDWTGWGIGWRIGQYSRLSDSNNAYRMLSIIFDPENRLIYPNLLGAHPIGVKDKVFQIDCNFGALAGICEMLVSSSFDRVNLLPALPNQWKNGYVYGLRAKGGFVINSLEWENSSLEKVSVYSSAGGVLDLTYKDKSITIYTEKGKTYTFNSNLTPIT